MKTFVVIEIFHGHQRLNNWKCGDLVHYVNCIADNYSFPETNVVTTPNLGDLDKESAGVKSNRDYNNLSGASVHHATHNSYAHSEGPIVIGRENKENSNFCLYRNDSDINRISALHEEQKEALKDRKIEFHYNYYMQCKHNRPMKDMCGNWRSPQATSKLTYRDLRQVFTDVNPIPSIEIRRHCIVLCLPPLSCVVMTDRVFVLVVEDISMDELISGISKIQLKHETVDKTSNLARSEPSRNKRCDNVTKISRLHLTATNMLIPSRDLSDSIEDAKAKYTNLYAEKLENENLEGVAKSSEEGQSYPMEFEIMELLMSASFERLDSDIQGVEERFETLTQKSEYFNSPTSNEGKELHKLKSRAKFYQDRVLLFDKAFDRILADEEELLGMELTRMRKEAQGTSGYFEKCPAVGSHVHKNYPEAFSHIFNTMSPNPDLEILLEFFDQELEMFRQRVQRLHEKIESMERLSTLRLSVRRNRLLRWDVGSSMMAVVFGLGAMISGIFGMNMKSGLEQSAVAFTFTSILLTCITVTFITAIFVLLRATKL